MTSVLRRFSMLSDDEVFETLEASAKAGRNIEEAMDELATGQFHFGTMPKLRWGQGQIEYAQPKSNDQQVAERIKKLQKKVDEWRFAFAEHALAFASAFPFNGHSISEPLEIWRQAVILHALFFPLDKSGQPIIDEHRLLQCPAYEGMHKSERLRVKQEIQNFMQLTWPSKRGSNLTFRDWLERSRISNLTFATQMWMHSVNLGILIKVQSFVQTQVADPMFADQSKGKRTRAAKSLWSLAELKERCCKCCGRETFSTSDHCSDCRVSSDARRGEAGRKRRVITENDSPASPIEYDRDSGSDYNGETVRDDI